MGKNRGKKFEQVICESFEKVPEVSVVRLHDQTTGYQASSNHCDFIVYKKPYEYHIECKSVHGNTLSIHSNPKPDKHGVLHGFYGNITDAQWEGLLEKSKIPGVIAGVICWWVDKDTTIFIPIKTLEECRKNGWKSVNYAKACSMQDMTIITGKKKRVFFDYDMDRFLKEAKWDINVFIAD